MGGRKGRMPRGPEILILLLCEEQSKPWCERACVRILGWRCGVDGHGTATSCLRPPPCQNFLSLMRLPVPVLVPLRPQGRGHGARDAAH